MLHCNRRRFGQAALATLGATVLPATAQAWPQRPIRVVVPYAAGGGLDTMARLLSTALAPRLGQPLVIENRVGASGTIGVGQVARTTGDSHAFVLSPVSPVVFARLMSTNLSYDPQRDLVPVGQLAEFPLALMVNPAKVPVRTLAELVEFARSRPPGTVTIGNVGRGSHAHLTDLLIERVTGIQFNIVPYSSSAQQRADFLSGVLDAVADVLTPWVAHIAQGQLRALAVMAPQRTEFLPDVPTSAEAGFPTLLAQGWYGLFAPRDTPREVVALMNQAMTDYLSSAEARAALKPLGVTAAPTSPQALQALLAREYAQWAPVIRSANLVEQTS